MDTQDLRQHNRYKTATSRIFYQRLHLLDRIGKAQQELIQFVLDVGAAEQLFHVAVFGQQSIQGREPFFDQFRHGQEPECVAGGCGIHYYAIIGLILDPSGNFEKGHKFVHAGHGEVQKSADVFIIQKSPPGGNLPKITAMLLFEDR